MYEFHCLCISTLWIVKLVTKTFSKKLVTKTDGQVNIEKKIKHQQLKYKFKNMKESESKSNSF